MRRLLGIGLILAGVWLALPVGGGAPGLQPDCKPCKCVDKDERKPLLPWRKIPVEPVGTDGPTFADFNDGTPRRPFSGRPNWSGRAKAGSGFTSPDGKEFAQCDLPNEYHKRNTVGTDGAGLCVFKSMHHTGQWQGDKLFQAIDRWMEQHPGGGYPEKVDRMLKQASRELGFPVPKYLHFTKPDLQILKEACKNRYMPCVTYGVSPTGRYGGQLIDHMVSLPHATDAWFCVLDNNYPGVDKLEWMEPNDFKIATTSGSSGVESGNAWFMILLTTPPPPAPKN